MKSVSAIHGMSVTEKADVDKFLESKLNIQLALIDGAGDLHIYPGWFQHDKDSGDICVITNKMSKKTHNAYSTPNIYFSIDDENFSVQRRRGRGG
ncbi:MAG TPA: pyridoxamine 5'-phosphate oxidase family protein [Nitrososphaera sp.]|nr:pyridoxamine 5'-phosphate oxidase family protein [Nitrososphaera sp.]